YSQSRECPLIPLISPPSTRWLMVALPFYSTAFTRYVFLQTLLAINLFLLCVSSMTDPGADHTVHNRLVRCNSNVTRADCAKAARAIGRLSAREIIIWSQHLTLGVLSVFSGMTAILAWATHASTWPCMEKQKVLYWWAPVAVCLVLLVHFFLALFHFLIIRVVLFWMAFMCSAVVLWDGFHFAKSLEELLPEPTQDSETPPSTRTPIKPPAPLTPIARTTVAPKKTSVVSQLTTVLKRQTTVPTKQTTVLTKQITVPSKQATVTAKQITVPAKQTIVPTKKTTVPAKQTSVTPTQTTALLKKTLPP
ncbi:hypothetical protein PFISCL1PPCAC_3544, partial [Pristionchus fissidentatus]